ncbi:hypothetical protein K2X33_09670 [bacterium]|nr:hypothetical protein [bacterium]
MSVESRFESVLEAICQDTEQEDVWLEMLSQLEFAGCRKIVKAVPFERVNTGVLQHIMEEASHAFLLRSLVRDREEGWATNPLTEAGWEYFQRLDHSVSVLEGSGYSYPVVAWVIERRVLELYPLYLKHTQRAGVRSIVTRILAQEKGHSESFGHGDFAPELRARAIETEAELWDAFVGRLEAWALGSVRLGASLPLSTNLQIG